MQVLTLSMRVWLCVSDKRFLLSQKCSLLRRTLLEISIAIYLNLIMTQIQMLFHFISKQFPYIFVNCNIRILNISTIDLIILNGQNFVCIFYQLLIFNVKIYNFQHDVIYFRWKYSSGTPPITRERISANSQTMIMNRISFKIPSI